MFVTMHCLLFVLTSLFTISKGTPCSDLDFPCKNGDCIDSALWCDSHKDCSDGSDEAYCKKTNYFNKNPNKCPDDYFKCNDGPCIPKRGRCDGYKSCEDNSDEKDCENVEPASESYTTTMSLDSDDFPSEKIEPYYPVIPDNGDVHPVGDFGRDENVFLELHPSEFSRQREKARKWLISQRLEDFGWGSETPRALTALYLSDESHYKLNETDMLMVKQLEVQLSLEIARNGTKHMALTDLALYINALMASCKDPRNFYGNDLVGVLRYSVNTARNAGKFISPAVYLTLCLNNDTTYEDTRSLHETLYSRNAALSRIDIQALSMLTATCAFNSNLISRESYDGFKRQFLGKLNSKRFTGNIYEAALVMQALNEARLDEMEWKRSDLKKFLLSQQQEDGSFGCILATYLVLPIFSGSSLLKLGKDCDMKRTKGFIPIEVLKNTQRRKIPVQYSLNFGDPVEVTQILQIQVAEDTNFLDIMRLAQEVNPKYRFMIDDTQEYPVVYSIGDVPNDAEKGMFWVLYVASANSRPRSDLGRLIPYSGNIKNLVPKSGDELVFWMKSI